LDKLPPDQAIRPPLNKLKSAIRHEGCLWQFGETEGYIRRIKVFMIFFIAAILFLPLPAIAQDVNSVVDPQTICMQATLQAEEKYQIQKYLLTSISTVETGKWSKLLQQKSAWPWTINVRGRGHYYKTKEAAIAAAKELRRKGIKSFDVGCMQINMKFHGKAFASLEDAFDPQTNVEYAARYLSKLYQKRQDWMQAATDYHSRRPKKAKIYKSKLLAALENVKAGHQRFVQLQEVQYASNPANVSGKAGQSWWSRLFRDDEKIQQEAKLSLKGTINES